MVPAGSGQAIAAMERVANQVLPVDAGYDWGGTAFQQKRSSGAAGLALGAGLLILDEILRVRRGR